MGSMLLVRGAKSRWPGGLHFATADGVFLAHALQRRPAFDDTARRKPFWRARQPPHPGGFPETWIVLDLRAGFFEERFCQQADNVVALNKLPFRQTGTAVKRHQRNAHPAVFDDRIAGVVVTFGERNRFREYLRQESTQGPACYAL